MQVFDVNLISNGAASVPGYEQRLRLGYSKNKGVYQLQVNATGEWDGLTIRAIWHLPDGTSTTTLAMDGCVAVPAVVTALSGNGCITFEGATEGKTVTSADLRYTVGANSGVDGGTLPEPNTPAWEQLVGTVAESAAQAEEAANRADKAAAAAEGALTAVEGTASKALTDITHTGAAQTQAVTRAGEQAVKEVDAAAQAGVGSVEQAQKTATQTIQTAATAAIQRVEQTGSTQVQAVTAAGAGQVKKIEDAAAEKLEGITQLAGQATDSATKAEQAAQRAEDAATAASAIIDDTVIADSKTWSSKGIVDTLCPPIQATGNPVVCYPVPGYPLGVTVDFAPIQEGEGDPSPDNVRPIKGRDSVTVERCGENLLNLPIEKESGGISVTTEPDGRYHLKGTLNRNGFSCSIGTINLPAGTYAVNKTSFSTSLNANAIVCTLRKITATGSSEAWIETTIRSGSSNIGSLAEPTNIIIAFYGAEKSIIEGTVIDTYFELILVSGTTAPTAYTPYTGQITSLTLPAPCYGGELDAVSGKGQETWHTIVLTGQESSHIFEKFFYLNIGNNPKPKDITSGRSSHYKYATYGKGCIGVTKDGVSAVLGAEGQFALDEAGLSAWKSYLAAQYAAGTPVTVAYIKATPTPITATGGKPIPALAGVNTVLTDGDSLTVTGRADPTHEIQQLRAAVVALGGTI